MKKRIIRQGVNWNGIMGKDVFPIWNFFNIFHSVHHKKMEIFETQMCLENTRVEFRHNGHHLKKIFKIYNSLKDVLKFCTNMTKNYEKL